MLSLSPTYRRRHEAPHLPMLALLLSLGCTGAIGTASETPVTPGGVNEPLSCGLPTTAPRTVQRFTRDQYDATIRDLIGVSGASTGFPSDDGSLGIFIGGPVSDLQAELWNSVAFRLASNAANRADFVPCDATDASCADEFIDSFALRAYRRPIDSETHAILRTVFDQGNDTGGFTKGVELVTAAVLQSPSFLYHIEPTGDAAPNTIVSVDDYALASRLSYFLWGSMPDDELFAAAANGTLRTKAGLLEQATRLLDHERSAGGTRSFYRQWLGLDDLEQLTKDVERFPAFNQTVAAHLRRSLELFLDEVFRSGTLGDLMTSRVVYVNRLTAPIFGLDPARFTDDFSRVEIDPRLRSGLLTHPALMALLAKPDQSDPVHRGVFVRERILCQTLPSPPANTVVVPPEVAAGTTTRERFRAHTESSDCAGCHTLINPIGFAFEHFDAIGSHRDWEEGIAVNATGTLTGTTVDGDVNGASELAHRLAGAQEVHDCMARQIFRFALKRPEQSADACAVDAIRNEFRSSNLTLRTLMLAIVQSDAFRFQRVEP